jgi:hypothetical protein
MKILLLLAFSVGTSFASEINLIPNVRTFHEEGGSIRRLTFKGPNADYQITIDAELEIEKLADGVRLTFTKIPSAIFDIRPSNADKNTPIAQENHPAYLKAARAHLPAVAKDIRLVEEIPDPHPINSWKSYRCVFDYSVNDVKKRMAITYITLAEGPQILLVTSSKLDEFEDSIVRSDTLIRSWFTIRDGESLPQNN